jgi:DNA-binding MarR family transcriptional regulator
LAGATTKTDTDSLGGASATKTMRADRARSGVILRAGPPMPKTADYSKVRFDVLKDLLSFYSRSVGVALNRDYDAKIAKVSLAKGTGKVTTLLLVGANPGIRPSVVAHFILKDRSATARLLDQMKRQGLLVEKVSARERRAHELYLTAKGQALIQRVRTIAVKHSDDFFAVLSSAEQDQLLRLLKKLYERRVADLPGQS